MIALNRLFPLIGPGRVGGTTLFQRA